MGLVLLIVNQISAFPAAAAGLIGFALLWGGRSPTCGRCHAQHPVRVTIATIPHRSHSPPWPLLGFRRPDGGLPLGALRGRSDRPTPLGCGRGASARRRPAGHTTPLPAQLVPHPSARTGPRDLRVAVHPRPSQNNEKISTGHSTTYRIYEFGSDMNWRQWLTSVRSSHSLG